ncbi:MAG: hypothetical protein ACKOW8_15205, partial [Flavobacteriales bacterium]
YNNVFFSKARSMARFGLLLLANGIWNGNDLLQDSAYFYHMTHASQDINQAYGYLTWLNNTENFMLPEYQFVYPATSRPLLPRRCMLPWDVTDNTLVWYHRKIWYGSEWVKTQPN